MFTRSIAAVTAAALTLAPLGPAAAAYAPQAVPAAPRGTAPGAPYVDPARCGALPDIILRMRMGLGNTDDEIRQTEEQLADARAGRMKSQEQRRQVFAKAFLRFMQNLTAAAQSSRASLAALHSLSPAAAAYRLTLYERLNNLLTLATATRSVGSSFKAGFAYGEIIQQARADLMQLMIFLQNSGLSDKAVSAVSNVFLPVIGPLIVAHAGLARDFIFAEMQVDFTEAEEREHQSNLLNMRNARRNHEFVLERLQQELQICSQTPPEGTQPPDSHLTPPLPEPQAEKQGGMSDTLFYGGLAALVGGAYLYSEYKKTAGEQCTPPSVNVLTVCSSQGGSSPACVQARTEMQAYCSCLGKGYSGGNCTS